MITKTYKSIYNPNTISLNIGGKTVQVRFQSLYKSVRQERFSSYTTSDENIQRAIERLRFFGERGRAAVWLDKTITTQEPMAQKETPQPQAVNAGSVAASTNKCYAEVTTYEEAKAIMMAAPYNCKVQAVNTLERLLARAKKEEILFPNLETA